MAKLGILAATLGAAVLLAGGPACATVVEVNFASPAPQVSQIIHFNGFVAGTNPDQNQVDSGITGEMVIRLDSITGDGYQWNFSYDLSNTSTAVSRLATIGWDIDPDIDHANGVTGVFTRFAEDGNMASHGRVEFCLKSGGGANCSGGGNGGLFNGASGSGLFSLIFASQATTYTTVQVPTYNKKGQLTGYTTTQVPQVQTLDVPANVKFSNFGIHYQSLAGGKSTVGIADGLRTAVPEPATWAMLILGFGGVGAVLRRRRTQFQPG